MNNEMDYVSSEMCSKALTKLSKRVAMGEDIREILYVEDNYYLEKITSGKVQMSVTIYERIMQKSA